MSKRIGDVTIIEEEPEKKCEECGKMAETRPYGIGGKRICFKCAMKDEKGTESRMKDVLFGIKEN